MPTLIKIQCYVCRDMLSTIIPSLKVLGDTFNYCNMQLGLA